MDSTDGLVSSVERNLDAVGDYRPENFTIFRVPPHILQSNFKWLYEPQTVSIGPYHRGNPALRAMQKHKWRYVRDLLARNRYRGVKDYVDKLRALEPQARECYFEPVELDADEFTEMLLLDGCFVIELLIKWNDNALDKVCSVGWTWSLIWCDLLLLDNQIPFFVIESLFDLLTAAFDHQCGIPPLMKLLAAYVTQNMGKEPPAEPDGEIHHLLHVYYLCFVGTPRTESFKVGNNSSIAEWLKPTRVIDLLLISCFCKAKKDEKRLILSIPCATELQEAGVTFKKKKEDISGTSGSFLDMLITFQNGVLEIPFLWVEDYTKSLFMNLVLFEQCTSSRERKYMTSYAFFMNCLINTARDVEILHESGIIENKLASKEELSFFFNELCKDMLVDKEHFLTPLFVEVREYCDSKWPKWRAKLAKDYFSNPWTVFSLMAAIALLMFAFFQTFFTILPYFHPHK